MSDAADRQKVMERNPLVRLERVEEYLEFEQKVRDQGLQTRPRYQVTSPLGPLEKKGQNTSASIIQRRGQK
jgi:hypothetical protein